MDPKLFLEYLPWLRKPDLLCRRRGYEPEYPDAYTSPKPRAAPMDLTDAPAAVRELYADHDLTNVHMLWTSFLKEPKRVQQGWHIAQMSETMIVVAEGTGRIEAYTQYPIPGMPGGADCLGLLARDLESYLEALLCGQMNKAHFAPGFPDEDPVLRAKTEHIARLCSLIAGGDEYYDFWAGVLGLPPPKPVERGGLRLV
jgi:hypothetical protein